MFVRNKKTGGMGFVPDNQFNPQLYEQVTDKASLDQLQSLYKQQAPQAQMEPQPQAQGNELETFRAARQIQWQNARNELERNRIAEGWKSATGTELFGKESGQETSKEEDAFNAVDNFINNLEKHYSAAGGGTFGIGPGARIKGVQQSIAGAVGLNDAVSTYNREKAGFAATLKSLTGDTGVLTEQDFKRLAKLLPDIGSTPKESANLFTDLRSQVAAKFGGQIKPSVYKPQSEDNKSALMNLISSIFPQTEKAMEAYQGEKPSALSSALPLVGLIGDEKYRENVPEAGMEILTAMGIGKGIKNIAKGAVPLLTSKSVAGKGIEKAVESTKTLTSGIKGDTIIAEIRKVYEAATPAEKKSVKGFLDAAVKQYKGKTIPLDVANKTLSMANDAYNAAGQIGNSAKAAVEAAVSRGIRKQIPQALTEARRVYGVAAGRDAFLKRSVYPAATGVGVGAGIYALLSALGIGRQNQ